MFKKANLENGITVLTEQIKNLRSVSIGIWVKVGSRNELPSKNGISHFLEHMFFKGTSNRTALDIAVETDALGGELNAFTSKEGTTFLVKVLDDYLEQGLELLADIFMNSVFPPDEIEREKGVVKEEIKMVEDTPDDYIHDIFCRSIWGKDGLGQTVLGKRNTVNLFTRQDLLGHIGDYYGTSDTIVSCAGNFEFQKLISLLNRGLGGLRRGSEPASGKPPVFSARTVVHNRELSEIHICLGIEGIPHSVQDSYRALLVNTILGGGVSSRLFQEIREKRGLAYSVYSFLSSYRDTGLWAVYAGTGRKRFNEVIEEVVKGFKELPRTLTQEELDRAKSHLKGNLMLGLESSTRRMQNIASQEIYFGTYYSPAEVMRRIDAVSLKSAREFAEKLISSGRPALTVLGPVEKSDLKASLRR
jgi:predicted Zn-dependent peptidase